MSDPQVGTVYLIHFDHPGPGGARHYIGWALDPVKRLERHRSGDGSKLLRAVNGMGIIYSVVRTWPGLSRSDESRLKRRHQHARLCPVCREEALRKHARRERTVRMRKALEVTCDGV